ncbi:MAG: hypothetical protein MRZ97_08095 [Firmicutes bacterium]|nr:hypothetical protein [Bacillota bacterium]
MDEERFTQNGPMQTGDDLTCPNCGSHRVRWMPYPKLETGIWYLVRSLADLFVRRLCRLTDHTACGACVLYHCTYHPNPAKPAGKAL